MKLVVILDSFKGWMWITVLYPSPQMPIKLFLAVREQVPVPDSAAPRTSIGLLLKPHTVDAEKGEMLRSK